MLVFTIIASMASAQVPAFFDPPATEARRQLYTVRVKKPPAVDGALDDDAWLEAVPSGDFIQYEPLQGEKATHKSTVRVVFDDDALYVAAELEQPGGWTAFNQRDMRRDFPNHESDSFTVILDTLGDGRNAFSFSVNPWGAQRDEQVVDDTLFEPNWDTVWRVATKRDERGWTVEFAIPWKSLRHGGPGVRWGVQFARRERGRNEDTVWSPIPRTVTPWRMAYAGLTVGLEAAKPSLLSLQLRPYLIGRMDVNGGGAPLFGGSGGGEVTWNPTDNTVVDLTGNTDFAETDVDRRVVNLTRFSVFFPERRQFFLESAGVFSAGAPGLLMPFFSRRIGLDDGGRAVTITAGGRLVYRSTDRSIGGLVVHTLPTSTANSSLFGVARYSQNVGEQSRLGGMVVARHDFEGVGGEGNTNVVPTLDGLYRAGPFTLQATLMGSTTSTRSIGTTFGGAGTLEAKVQGNWGSIALSGLGVSPGFEARSGFVGRTDILGAGVEAELDYRPKWLPSFIRSIGPFIDSLVLWTASTGQFQEATTYFSPLWMLFSGGDEAWLFVETSQQVLTEAFQPVNNVSFAPGSYSYEKFGAAFLTQASRKASVYAEVQGGEYYTANLVHAVARASVQPLPYISVSGQYTYNHFWGPGVVGEFANTHLLLVEGRLAVSPKLQLIGSYQRDTDGNASVLNARLAWEFLPLSFVYVVLTDTRNAYPVPNAPPSELRVVAKVTYTWRP